MTLGLVGTKCGMTRVFTKEGKSLPITVLQIAPNFVTQIKTPAKEGFSAIQLTTGQKRAARVNKPLTGHFKKAGVDLGRGLWEFPVTEETLGNLELGAQYTVDYFAVGQKINVTAISKGKGFSGVIKRWNFKSQRASHGNSLSHNAPGSIGQCQTPGRVFKGKKMAGQLGNEQVTIQNLEVVRVDLERHLLLVRGAVPGAKGADVIVLPAA